jgi:carboxylesterase type B
MDFSSLVLIEKDKETGFIKKELGSFEVNEGALFVKKLYVLDEIVYMYFDTNKNVEEWEYSAIYDLFNGDVFIDKGYEIEEDLDEYNPTYIIKFKYVDDYDVMKEKIREVVSIIEKEMNAVFEAIKGKEAEYQE